MAKCNYHLSPRPLAWAAEPLLEICKPVGGSGPIWQKKKMLSRENIWTRAGDRPSPSVGLQSLADRGSVVAFSWKQLRIPAVPVSTWGTFQKKSALVKVEV